MKTDPIGRVAQTVLITGERFDSLFRQELLLYFKLYRGQNAEDELAQCLVRRGTTAARLVDHVIPPG